MEGAYDVLMPRIAPTAPLRLDQEARQINEAQEARRFYGRLREKLEANGASEYLGAKHLAHRFDHEPLFVRREDPLRIEALFDGVNLMISTDGKGYVNATRWDQDTGMECLTTAFLEGRTDHHSVVTVAGYAKSALKERTIKPGMDANPLHDGRIVCSVEGTIEKQDLRFLLVRIPVQRFSEADMTEEELEAFEGWSEQKGLRKPLYIFRLFTFETVH